jgi:hypothetical protein
MSTNVFEKLLRKVIPTFANLTHSQKTACKEKTRHTVINFPLLPALYITIGSR